MVEQSSSQEADSEGPRPYDRWGRKVVSGVTAAISKAPEGGRARGGLQREVVHQLDFVP